MAKNRPYGDFSGTFYFITPITHKQIREANDCSGWLITQIIKHAGGSFYRANAGDADCYAFTIDDDGKDWGGGWDWSNNLVDDEADYIYKFDDKRFYKIDLERV